MLRNVRLIEELRASRQRLVAAQDEERRKLERNLHDGAQQQLVALAVQLKLLERWSAAIRTEDRELVRACRRPRATRSRASGSRPRHLPAAACGQGTAHRARGAGEEGRRPDDGRADGIGRYPQDVEAAVYFCTLEALNNVAKYAGATHANVRLAQDNGTLVFEVHDDGAGFDPATSTFGTGLQGMADRLDAIGGSLHVESAPGIGTTIAGRVPTARDGR